MDFAEFYRRSKDECLRTVLISVGDQDTAQELVAEAFARRTRSTCSAACFASALNLYVIRASAAAVS
jgi:hypothetical protein